MNILGPGEEPTFSAKGKHAMQEQRALSSLDRNLSNPHDPRR